MQGVLGIIRIVGLIAFIGFRVSGERVRRVSGILGLGSGDWGFGGSGFPSFG